MPMRRLLLASSLLLGLAGTVRAQGLVIRAQGPRAATYRVGAALAPGTMVAAGDRVDVLERGGTRQLVGPTRYFPVARSTASDHVRLVVTQLLDRQKSDRNAGATIAATRSFNTRGFAPRPFPAPMASRFAETLWAVDATAPGVACFPAGTAPLVWHAAVDGPSRAKLVAADGTTQTVRWPAGSASAVWPAPTIPAATGYTLRMPDGTETTTRLVPIADAPTLDDLAVALDAAGCRAQLDYLLGQYPGALAK